MLIKDICNLTIGGNEQLSNDSELGQKGDHSDDLLLSTTKYINAQKTKVL